MARKPKRDLYHIILVNHGKQLRDLFHTNSEIKVNKEFAKMLKENKKVVFVVVSGFIVRFSVKDGTEKRSILNLLKIVQLIQK